MEKRAEELNNYSEKTMKENKIKLKEFLPIIILLVLIAAIVVLLLFRNREGKTSDPEVKTKYFYGFYSSQTGEVEMYFDTACSVYDYSGMDEGEFSALCGYMESSLEKYHKLFDIYNEYDGVVNLATINANAGNGPIKVSRELFEFLEYAVSLYDLTGGEMNIAMGSVLLLWHNAREAASSGSAVGVPEESTLREAFYHSNIENLRLDKENLTVELSDPLMRLDVGAVGKGYAAEMIAKRISEKGYSGIVIDLGGNLRAVGSKPSGDGWETGIRNPEVWSSEKYIKKVKIKNTSVVTSGDYERFFVADGVRYHHIIDKDTLMPADYFSSVTVITKHSGLADGLSTALFSMSYDDGCTLIDSIKVSGTDIKVVWVTKAGEVLEK